MSEEKLKFPDGFVWGTATAAYQIEGAWNEDGVSIWDAFTQSGGHVSDGNNGNIACDSYHRYKEDIALMKQLGVSSYRMSLSWPRIIPDPLTGEVNPKGVAYYNRVIDSLLAEGITPCVTLYHWDLPLVLEEKIGGWPKEEIIPYYVQYAEACFKAFGDRVKTWITFNEPSIFLGLGYVTGYHAPGRKDIAEKGWYACVHNVIRAHAQVYRLYQEKFKTEQKGVVGITLNTNWTEAKDPNNPEDVAASDRYLQFNLGAFAHPIYVDGDYPDALKKRLAERSQGGKSRLPEFTDAEKALVKGSADFFGLNYYTTRYVTTDNCENDPTFKGDCNFQEHTDPKWIRGQSMWLYSVPWGLRKLLKFIKTNYGSPVVYITENGFSDATGTFHDEGRIQYIPVSEDGVDIRGYYCWTLLDNFEWAEGFNERFGLFHVDITDPERKRTPKDSVKFFREVTQNNAV
ncbi:hypothetical protein BaRGS_00003624 [Batillaria attramentaria]|uniref:beta-glucosidase n=1 Tax=Batillaria attramentaria TaxID=370345 RepID=A0ABD0LZE1_9CAEN